MAGNGPGTLSWPLAALQVTWIEQKRTGAASEEALARFVRHGGRHDLWENEDSEKESQIPRHPTIKKNTARKICDDLGVPRHSSL